MRVLIAGGSGFLGRTVRETLRAAGHDVRVLSRRRKSDRSYVHWGASPGGNWAAVMDATDAVVNACGFGLEHWPWNAANKRRFLLSRVEPSRALAAAVARAHHRPRVFIQFSGTNRYGLRGAGIADESTAPAGDYLAQLTVPWEEATAPLAELGVRRVIARNAVVLHPSRGLFPLMSLACRLFVGGRFGDGSQYVPWIHADDHARAIKHLLENDKAEGPFNLVAPEIVSNDEFMRAICRVLGRPYWFHVPALALRLVLGEMSNLILEGRAVQPKRLLESGFGFRLPTLELALNDMFSNIRRRSTS